MTATVRSVTASDGYSLRLRHYSAKATCRGIVVALHGIQSHSGWYDRSSQAMADAGFDVYFMDRRGSGLNDAQRGHADHGFRLINDVRHGIRLARAEQGDAQPLLLLAVSWGGRIAAAVAAAAPAEIDGLALLYPGLEPKLRPTRWQRQQLRLARHFDIRHRQVPIPLTDPALFTDNLQARDDIRNDPLALHEVTSGFLNAGQDLDELSRRYRERITHPALLMLAGRDRIIDNERTLRRVAEFGTRHLTTITFPAARHTLEFEPDSLGFVPLLVHWLQQWADGRFCVPADKESKQRPSA